MSVAAVPYPSLSPELGWSGTLYVQISLVMPPKFWLDITRLAWIPTIP